MAAWIVGTITIRDEGLWPQYVAGVTGTFERYGGELILRGVSPQRLAGSSHGERVVVVRFADMEALRRWHDSREYQALIPLRDSAADVVLTAYHD
jgi:uncharacterized protein (DUF1330 family)